MQYGYFDDARREYVITRPDTPRSWINYVGSRLYGGIITQNAGGYSFYRSGGRGRILRMRFNGIPQDQPGRYLYLRDDEDGDDYWSASWQPVAKPLDGRGDRAYTYYRSYLPARYNAQAEVRQAEPYVYSQFTYGKASPRFGQSRNPWLTGTASWTYIAVTQYLLGAQPIMEGLRIDPCIRATWDAFQMRRRFRGKWVSIRVENPRHVNQGIRALTLNGELLAGNVIPADRLGETNLAVVVLS
jgi:cellobiose phosphorylase